MIYLGIVPFLSRSESVCYYHDTDNRHRFAVLSVYEPQLVISNNCGSLISVDPDEPVQPPF